jgi:tripartite-type tricarboxylate transporter receptor subunit TctC
MKLIWHIPVAAMIAFSSPAQAAWPERPVTLVVPFAAGGITDVVARLAAERLQNSFKQNFVVENRVGAAGVIATEHVARAAPDGYTLLYSSISQIAIAPFTHKVSYDPVKDFQPIAMTIVTPFFITVSSAFPANTLEEFINYVKTKPGQLTYGSSGPGGPTHINSAVMLKRAGLDMIHVPYRGVAPAFTALLAGEVHMISASPVELKPYLESKTVKLLGASSPKRVADFPNVPSIAEMFPGHSVLSWAGVLAPARTPHAVVDPLSRELVAIGQQPAFRKRVGELGLHLVEPHTPADFQKVIAEDLDRWEKIVNEYGLKVQ